MSIKGVNDVWPGCDEAFLDAGVWERLFSVCGTVLRAHGFARVWLPVFEETALYARSIGADTDIVAKEMYTFTDRGGRSLTLRPEGTAGAVRAYVEHNLARENPVQRWWYAGPMFRAERPQKGRYRQFYQIGAELFGAGEPLADAELLLMLWRLCEALGLTGVRVRINTLGVAADRRAFRQVLLGYFETRQASLCESCRARLAANPLRVLDCKRPSCREIAQGAPDILSVLSADSRAHFDAVLAWLGALGVPSERDPHLVRGLDYYTRTTFELVTDKLGAQDAILGGGRYDNLVQELGGPPTPALGFAAGVERLALLLAEAGVARRGPHLYLIPLPGCELAALRLADALRALGVSVELAVAGGKLKAQMRDADRAHARTALVLGGDEIKSERGRLRDLRRSTDLAIELNPAALHATLRELAVDDKEPRA